MEKWSCYLTVLAVAGACMGPAPFAFADPVPFPPLPIDLGPLACLTPTFSKARAATRGAPAIEVTLVSNQKDGVAQYTKGYLSYDLASDSFRGNGASLFSDRSQSGSWCVFGRAFCLEAAAPFSASAQDDVRLELRNDGRLDVILSSWGDARASMPLRCVGTELVGRGAPVGGGARQASYVLSLNRFDENRPPH